jgi:hypothetical protein
LLLTGACSLSLFCSAHSSFKDPLFRLAPAQKKVLWQYRDHIRATEPNALPKLVASVDWTDQHQVAELHRLLVGWPLLPPEFALGVC